MASLRASDSRLFVCALALAGCEASLDARAVWFDEVVDAPGADGSMFGDPVRAVNGVRGAGVAAGSVDVYSIDSAARPSLTLRVGGRRVTDGPGVDFVVFENGFRTTGEGSEAGLSFMDPALVELSIDGVAWIAFPHDYVAADPTEYSRVPDDWEGFAGIAPVLFHAETNPVDPFDVVMAGGDGFDLALLPDEGVGGEIRRAGFRYLRLSPAFRAVDPHTGASYPRDGFANGPDIDGVAVRYVVDDGV